MLIENIKTLILIAFMAGWILVISELSMMANGLEVENFYSQRLAYSVPSSQKGARAMQVQQWATTHLYKGNILTQTWVDLPMEPHTTLIGPQDRTLQTKRSFTIPLLFSFFLSPLTDDCKLAKDKTRGIYTLCAKQGAIQ